MLPFQAAPSLRPKRSEAMRFLQRFAVSIPTALFLAVVLVGQTLGATWSAKIVVDQSSVGLSDLATFANGTAIAALEDCVGGAYCTGIVALRRSTDGGATWGPRIRVAPIEEFDEADMPALAGRGKLVDLVWRGQGLLYRRSRDQGQTFGRARYISQVDSVQYPDVARGADGLVAISWGEWPEFTDQVSVRVSADGGRTFGAKHSWPSNDTYYTSVAVGDGVVYLAYINAAGQGVLRRSLDAGETWSAAVMVGYAPAVTAEGSDAYVAGSGMYRRTTNRGASWSLSAPLAPPGSNLYDSFISLQDGVARAVYGGPTGMYYRQSADGLNWSTPQKVSLQSDGFVGRAGDRVVLLFHNDIKTLAKTRPL